MTPPSTDLRKEREILFQGPHPDPDQAATAAALLADVEGILEVEATSEQRLVVAYDIRWLGVRDIEAALDEVGFHLDNSLLSKLRRTIWYYAEETQRANMGCQSNDCTYRIFVDRYQHRAHGCRDDRPQHWRRYL